MMCSIIFVGIYYILDQSFPIISWNIVVQMVYLYVRNVRTGAAIILFCYVLLLLYIVVYTALVYWAFDLFYVYFFSILISIINYFDININQLI